MKAYTQVQNAALAVFCAVAICLTTGCSRTKESPPAAAPAPSPAKSDVQTVIDGVTGRTAVDAHKKARATIDNVKAEDAADMQEAENF
ncbi:MAG: hypothetical protein O3B24_04955 [Verrucomicrobia bacterium]|nr:hypothetical protein [Verrucomicrobiota bacterium]